MIQRIQSVFLLAAIGLHALLFKVNFYTLKINENDAYYSAWESMNTGSNEIHINAIHIVLQFALIGLTLFTIFRFNNRKQQMKLCLYLLAGTALSFLFSLYNLFTTNYTEFHFGLGTYIISITAILYISSYFFIRKDDNLVKSADRLR
jgi:peptidoglycan/LPS O-acetylase OafA/YrhL